MEGYLLAKERLAVFPPTAFSTKIPELPRFLWSLERTP